MVAMWEAPALALIDRREAGWSGLWSLLDAAEHGALALTLQAQLGAGVDLAFAAMDLAEAREELEWVRPELALRVSDARLGPLPLADDLGDARAILERLVGEAVERVLRLADDPESDGQAGCLGRVLRKLHAAQEELARAAA